MQIKDKQFKTEQKLAVKEALMDFIQQSNDKSRRPCPVCRFAVGTEHSTTSTIHCSYQCPQAPAQMSDQPQKYPIEPNIVPLVYAFYALRILTPCWSCEGHNDSNGELFKTPKVWFYATHDLYAKLLAQCVSTLKGEGKLNNQWNVLVLPYSQSMFINTYSLEPQIIASDGTTLNALHREIKVIADNLHPEMIKLSQYYIKRAEQSIN